MRGVQQTMGRAAAVTLPSQTAVPPIRAAGARAEGPTALASPPPRRPHRDHLRRQGRLNQPLGWREARSIRADVMIYRR